MELEFIKELFNYGVPAIICGWFMFRIEKVLIKNTEAFNKLEVILSKLMKNRK